MYRVSLTCPAQSIYCTGDKRKEKHKSSWCHTADEQWSLRQCPFVVLMATGKKIVNVDCCKCKIVNHSVS